MAILEDFSAMPKLKVHEEEFNALAIQKGA
jgi:hypothetical protein